MHTKKVILSIAGSDSGGGAGIQADIKAISALGGYACSVITAITAQNTMGVREVMNLPPRIIEAQLDAIGEDFEVSAVKIGMLSAAETVEIVERAIRKYSWQNIVLDPVMVSTSGDSLSSNSVMNRARELLFPIVDVLTPNIIEAEILSGQKIQSVEDMLSVAKTLSKDCKNAVLIKGGHFFERCAGAAEPNDATISNAVEQYQNEANQAALRQSSAQTKTIKDVLYIKESDEFRIFENEFVETKNLHGTGCSLSSALARCMADFGDLGKAYSRAKDYLNMAIRMGANQRIGKGNGPVEHFFEICRYL